MRSFLKLEECRDDEMTGEPGFTLIELLIVVLILGILAAIVAFAVGAFTSQSVTAACETDARSVATAISAYGAHNGGTPGSVSVLSATPGAGDPGGPYLRTPFGNSGYYRFGVDASGNVTVQLGANDPAARLYQYTATGTTSAVSYDGFRFAAPTGGQKSGLAGLNICAGA